MPLVPNGSSSFTSTSDVSFSNVCNSNRQTSSLIGRLLAAFYHLAAHTLMIDSKKECHSA
jgi:hypothetical protein